jgi:Lon protease-like protein
MSDDQDVRDPSPVCRVFPLPGVVLFPHAVLPLHIFEPRYRQMTEDALAGDQLVTIVPEPLEPRAVSAEGEAVLDQVACLGRIIEHQRLPDGRFLLLLLGRMRVRLTREVASDRLYPIARAEVLEDQAADDPDGALRAALIALFRHVSAGGSELQHDLEALLETLDDLGIVTDLVAHALPAPMALKQLLLAETRVARRAELLIEALRRAVADSPAAPRHAQPFPPTFSTN